MIKILRVFGLVIAAFLWLLFIGLPFSASIRGDDKLDWSKFFGAIRQVESNGDDTAVGDNGESKGPYQIQKNYWLDGGGKVEDYETKVFDRDACEKVMLGYFQRYCPKAVLAKDWKTIARIHNGGPQGDKKKSSLKYWDKVKIEMERANNVRMQNRI